MSELSPEAALVRESLQLQQTILPELREDGRDAEKTSSVEGLGRHALSSDDITISFNGRTWREAELTDSASMRIHAGEVNRYRVEIRRGDAQVYDQDEQRVVDRTILEKLTGHVITIQASYDLGSASFEDEHREVLQ